MDAEIADPDLLGAATRPATLRGPYDLHGLSDRNRKAGYSGSELLIDRGLRAVGEGGNGFAIDGDGVDGTASLRRPLDLAEVADGQGLKDTASVVLQGEDLLDEAGAAGVLVTKNAGVAPGA